MLIISISSYSEEKNRMFASVLFLRVRVLSVLLFTLSPTMITPILQRMLKIYILSLLLLHLGFVHGNFCCRDGVTWVPSAKVSMLLEENFIRSNMGRRKRSMYSSK